MEVWLRGCNEELREAGRDWIYQCKVKVLQELTTAPQRNETFFFIKVPYVFNLTSQANKM